MGRNQMRRWLLLVAAVGGFAGLPTGHRSAPCVVAADDASPNQGPGLAPAPAARPSAPAGKTAALSGSVERAGKGAQARVQAWSLGRRNDAWTRRVLLEQSYRPPSIAQSADDASAWWLDPDATRRATRILAKMPPPDAEAASGEDGAFRLDGLDADAEWLLLATPKEGGGAYAFSHRQGQEPRGPVRLRLPEKGHVLMGRASRHDGKPYEGIVALLPATDPFPAEGTALPRLLDAEGRFRFDSLGAGGWRLRLTDEDGTVTKSGTVWLPRAEPYEFVVDEPRRVVKGLVHTPAGAPVPFARIFGSAGDATREVNLWLQAGADGAFNIRLPARVVELGIEAPGHRAASVSVAADAASIDVVMTAWVRVHGRVVDARTGSPVPGVPVRIASAGAGVSPFEAAFVGTSDAEGRFEVEAKPAAAQRLFALGAGWMSEGLAEMAPRGYDPLVIDVTAAGEAGVELRVVPSARIEGLVVGAGGVPIAAAKLSVTQAVPMTGMCGNSGRQAPIHSFLPDPDDVVSGVDGRFVVSDLRPGLLYYLYTSAPGHERDHRSISLDEGGPTALTIQLAPRRTTGPPRRVTVTVVAQESGMALPDATVALSDPEADAPREVRTDASGLARFEDVPAVQVHLEVKARGRVDSSEWMDALPAQSGELARRVEMAPALFVIGRVVDPEGKPVARASVQADRRGALVAPVITTEDGRFVLGDLPPGPVTVSAWISRDSGNLAHSEDVEAGRGDVEIRLVAERSRPGPGFATAPTTSAHARFRVVGPDGAPVESGRYAMRHFAERATQISYEFSGGTIDVSPVDVGQWTIVAYAGARASGGPRLGPVESARFTMRAPPSDAVLRMPEGVVLAGRVSGPDGAPVAGAVLYAIDPQAPKEYGSQRREALSTARSGVDGMFRLEGLRSAPVLLLLDVPPAFVEPSPSQARPGAEPIQVRLEAAANPWITVLDTAGNPVAGAIVGVALGGGAPNTYDFDQTIPRTSPRGRCRLLGLDPRETYVLGVELPRDARRFLPFRLDGWKPADTTVRLSSPTSVSGVVHTPDGKPLEGAMIAFDPAGSATGNGWGAKTAADGTFTLPGLAPGEGTLRYWIGAGGETLSIAVTVPARDLELVLAPGSTWVLTLEGMPPASKGFLEVRWTPWREDGAPTKDGTDITNSPWVRELRFQGLVPEQRYAIYVRDEVDDLVAYVPDLPGSGGTKTLVLRPAGSVSGRVRFVDPYDAESGAYVTVDDRGFSRYAFSEKGAFQVTGLPPGRFTIHARGHGLSLGMDENEKVPEATATVAAGDTVELTVPARPAK